MKGDKKTFIDGKYFYKEYSKNEFYFLKMLHGVDGLHIDTITYDDIQYIEMPKGHVISIDTMPKEKRSNVKHIIIKNIPFMLDQVALLNNLCIYYSDVMQWLYYNNRLYLIDFDTAYMTKIDCDHNNYDLLINFLVAFDIDYNFIKESLCYLDLFKTDASDIDYTFYNGAEKELYNRLNKPDMQKNHVYYSKNQRHMQINHIANIHIYGESGNMLITETILNPEVAKEWELIKIV
jgi:hypothetical protein